MSNVIKRLVSIILMVPLSAGISVAQGGLDKCGSGPRKFIPNILGLSVNEAKELVEKCELSWSFSPDPGTMSYEAIGTVGAQEPSGGSVGDRGDLVRGFVSRGFYLPDFEGELEAIAVAFAKDLRLKFVVHRVDNEASAGTVIDQFPAGADFFNSGTPINFTVSNGPYVLVPKGLLGSRRSEAGKLLEEVGLKPKLGTKWCSEMVEIVECTRYTTSYEVYKTDPTRGSRIPENSAVRLFFTRKTEKGKKSNTPSGPCPEPVVVVESVCENSD